LTSSKSRHKHTLSRSEKIAIPIIILIAIWVVYSISHPTTIPNAPTTSSTQMSGNPVAPDFTLSLVSGGGPTGQTVSLSSFRGKVVLLEFMEPWCPHCQKMAPVLEKLYNEYGKGNIVFLTIAGPWQGATVQDTAQFIKDYGSTWSYVYDSSGSVMSAYGVNATPAFMIIGRDGSIVARYEGEQSYDILVAGLAAASA
jgi:thiol-disulfide isomerase/thioredoxin